MYFNNEEVIRQLDTSDLPLAVEVIRESFATVAKDLGLTEQNCPKFVGFITTTERLLTHQSWGWRIYGLYENERLVGYVSISKEKEYEIHNLAVLPEFRHKGYGKKLLDFCVERIVGSGGDKVIISITEENTVLRNWYVAYGFVHTGTKRFDHLPFTVGYMELAIRSDRDRDI
ncbi:MAG: GNAT family N-acetyltransferase [Oscillospiraceae bacterium]|nr:GNAT family N-acetyltransferase [Oscillospiraceae bacterium]